MTHELQNGHSELPDQGAAGAITPQRLQGSGAASEHARHSDLRLLLSGLTRATDAQTNLGQLGEALGGVCDTPERAYEVVLGRAIDPGARASSAGRPIAELVCDLLRSDEFRVSSMERLLNAHPAVGRGFFIHVPKTGGTTIEWSLDSRDEWSVWNAGRLTDQRTTSALAFVRWLQNASERMAQAQAKEVWLTGHAPLITWTSRGLVREHDRVWTVLRHPVELVLSYARFMLSEIRKDPLLPDALRWSSWLAEALDPTSEDNCDVLVSALMRSASLREALANPYTKLLGTTGLSGLDAYRHARSFGCRFIRLSDVDGYLLALGCTSPPQRLNVGTTEQPELSDPELVTIVQDLLEEDFVFYGLASWVADSRLAVQPQAPLAGGQANTTDEHSSSPR